MTTRGLHAMQVPIRLCRKDASVGASRQRSAIHIGLHSNVRVVDSAEEDRRHSKYRSFRPDDSHLRDSASRKIPVRRSRLRVSGKLLNAWMIVCAVCLAWVLPAIVADEGRIISQSFRNNDFPRTYISRIHLDLTAPFQYVRLAWVGPDADLQEKGPFASSPGCGWGTNDCDDVLESNCPDSRCTPKGRRTVEGFREHLKGAPECRHVTFIDVRRRIGFHSHPSVPPFPDSQGCVRLEPYAAQLVYENSIEGVTEILIDGTWTNPKNLGSGEPGVESDTESQKAPVRSER